MVILITRSIKQFFRKKNFANMTEVLYGTLFVGKSTVT